jgi:hypothetical protein
MLFHSGVVDADFSSNLSLLLAGLQEKKNVSFWIGQGAVPGVVEIGREWRPVCARVLNC